MLAICEAYSVTHFDDALLQQMMEEKLSAGSLIRVAMGSKLHHEADKIAMGQALYDLQQEAERALV